METVTIASARGLELTDMVLLVISVTTIIGVIAWQLIGRNRDFRGPRG
jgi:hypothetical protein